jgi:hypothetical protein
MTLQKQKFSALKSYLRGIMDGIVFLLKKSIPLN